MFTSFCLITKISKFIPKGVAVYKEKVIAGLELIKLSGVYL